MNDVFKLLELESREIAHFFEKASLEGKGTPQEVSDRREIAVTKFLRKFFPFPYQVAKGNVVDSFGARSASIDCLLLNPSHPHTIGDDSKYSMIFADGVDAAIEVKPHLNSDVEISRGLKQIQSLKKLKRVRTGVIDASISAEEREAFKRIPSFIFAVDTYKDIRLLVEKIVTHYEQNKVPSHEQFDFIVVDRQIVLFNSRKNSYFQVNSGTEGICFVETEANTLAVFLYWLNRLPQSQLRMSSSVLEHYIPWKVDSMKTFHDLNKRLSSISLTDA
ncbi:hypothetical protein E4T66_12410 [Sinimarinibacterium sp. CAU 1509]|uniref:DUF6602 domain-containing protein n=1 Tax=Sinimarinibacterium sp. CAU 1509 TaxID=2562283 RepID=UPI0010AD7621|nr:DUF6602 domain-containing protein [Sinimarinibacterium sp. CAU 1509]TJY59978.1 hypothetical protein E4T66_12410 [Sinimarinibacterium sp. CAU 1509]